ncbi:helix-turn-helix transcriptional regulator [Maridesulfovibrio sp.]|uniref:helix-turn-helix domain-containing protein n=1 Tax=Maridesulfovibrio sp. TaxID=2795000 RepID=UPI002AA81B4E|nr:helix-turn-helix transcriptional regulator [Maridesulfovibrio sp.]
MSAAAVANPHAGVRSGKKRYPWRIKEWMSAHDLTQIKIAKDIGISKSIVSSTINGSTNNKKVLAYLRDKGCPQKYLSLPEEMKEDKE